MSLKLCKRVTRRNDIWYIYVCRVSTGQPEDRAAAQHSLRVVYNETRVEQPKVGGENFPYLKRLGYSKPRERCSRQQFCIESPTPNFNQLTFGFFFPRVYIKVIALYSSLFPSLSPFFFPSISLVSTLPAEFLLTRNPCTFLTGTLLSLSPLLTECVYIHVSHTSLTHTLYN